MNPDHFSLDTLISSMKDLRHVELGDQVRSALENARLGFDPNTLAELVHELETDIEEHIERLEKISSVLTPVERANPEDLPQPRRSEVAFQSGCDLEEVDSLCEAFARAREMLSSAGRNGALDIRLLFSNLPGLSGLEIQGADGVPKVPAQILEEVLGKRVPAQQAPAEGNLDELFDLEGTAKPKNRLPKDWKP